MFPVEDGRALSRAEAGQSPPLDDPFVLRDVMPVNDRDEVVDQDAGASSPGSMRTVRSTLRSFFRFLRLEGFCGNELETALPATSRLPTDRGRSRRRHETLGIVDSKFHEAGTLRPRDAHRSAQSRRGIGLVRGKRSVLPVSGAAAHVDTDLHGHLHDGIEPTRRHINLVVENTWYRPRKLQAVLLEADDRIVRPLSRR